MSANVPARRVDYSALRVNQAFIIGLTALAFILNSPALVVFVAGVLLLGTVAPRYALFQAIYHHILEPACIVRPDIVFDNPEPHRFAQGLAGAFMFAGFVLLALGQTLSGWILAGIVAILAAANLLLGFCAGCFLYYQLNRLGVPGFHHGPLHQGRI